MPIPAQDLIVEHLPNGLTIVLRPMYTAPCTHAVHLVPRERTAQPARVERPLPLGGAHAVPRHTTLPCPAGGTPDFPLQRVLERLGHPLDYYARLPERIRAIRREDILRVAPGPGTSGQHHRPAAGSRRSLR